MADADFLGTGWPFPVRAGQGGRVGLVSGEEKIRESVWMVLATAPGERRMRPEFGCGIHDLVFSPNTSRVRALTRQRTRDALTRWEPRIDVLDVRVDSDADQPNVLLIGIDYRVRANNAVFNLVYPFFLQEGAGAQP